MPYQFEFITDKTDKNKKYNTKWLYIWSINDTKKKLLFRINVYEAEGALGAKYIHMYHSIKNNKWPYMNCEIWSHNNDPYTGYYIDTDIDHDGTQVVIISEYNLAEEITFELRLPWHECDKGSFIEFLRQMILQNGPNARISTNMLEEYIHVCKHYNMYIPINTKLLDRILAN